MKYIIFIIGIFYSYFIGASEVEDPTELELFTILNNATPIHIIFLEHLDKDNDWPLVRSADLVSKKQLSCIREYYSESKLAEYKAEIFLQYFEENEASLINDIKVLNEGLANTSRDFWLSISEPQKMTESIMTLMSKLNYKDDKLHEILMIDGFPSESKNGVVRMVTTVLFRSLKGCGVSIKQVFNNSNAYEPPQDQ